MAGAGGTEDGLADGVTLADGETVARAGWTTQPGAGPALGRRGWGARRPPAGRRRPKAPVPASSRAPAAPTAIQGASSELVAARPPVPALTAETDPPRA